MNYDGTFRLVLFAGLTFLEPEHLKKNTQCFDNNLILSIESYTHYFHTFLLLNHGLESLKPSFSPAVNILKLSSLSSE